MQFKCEILTSSVDPIYQNIKGWREDAKYDGEDYKDIVAEITDVKDVDQRDDYYEAISKKIEKSKVRILKTVDQALALA
jgi:hypothetical protein